MSRFFMICWLGLAALGAATASRGETSLLDLPKPDLSAMQEPVRQRVGALMQAIEELRQDPARTVELSRAYGRLGQHYHAFELLDAALIAYRNAQSLARDDPRWPYYVGLVQHMRGEIEEEVASYRRVLELRDEPGAPALRLARALLDLDRADEAEPLFERHLAIEPYRAAAHFGLGKIAAERRQWELAVDHFEQALALQPQASLVQYPLGQAYRRAGNLDKAKEHLARRGRDDVRFPDPLGSEVAWLAAGTAFDVVQALAKNAESFSDRDYLGFVLSQLGDVEGAIDGLEKALQAESEPGAGPAAVERARIHYALGGLLVHRKLDEKAAAHFQAAVELDPSLLDARVKLGNVLARQGDLAAAVAEYSAVLERDPDSAGALIKRAAARMQLGEVAPAVTDLERLLVLEPENSEAYSRLAAIYQGMGNAARALELFQVALKLDLSERERVLIHYESGNLLRQQKAWDEAVEHYTLALELNPELPEARFYLAGVLGTLGRLEEAAENYRQVVSLDPRHAGARQGEITALTLMNDFKAALERLDEGLSAMPEDVDLKHVLARLLASCPERSLRDGERALALAREVFTAVQSFEHAATVAMALAEVGLFEQAAEWQRALLNEASGGRPEEIAQLERHLALYESGQACCGL